MDRLEGDLLGWGEACANRVSLLGSAKAKALHNAPDESDGHDEYRNDDVGASGLDLNGHSHGKMSLA